MDRLKELQSGSGQSSIGINTTSRPSRQTTAMVMNGTDSAILMKNHLNSSSAGGGKTGDASQFFSDIDMCKRHINTIKETSLKVADITQEAILATSDEKEAELNSQIKPLLDSTNNSANWTKSMLKELKSQTAQMKETDPTNTDIRVRDNLLSTMTRKFVEVMKEYQQVQTNYRTQIVKKTKRQVEIVKPDATPEEVDAIVMSGGADQLIQQQILTGNANESVKQMYENVQSKYNEVLAIEKSVQEIQQMFVDFALLVEQQGELLDSIEFQVQQTIEHVDEGNVQMEQAIQYRKNIVKCRIYLCIILMTIVGIIVAILVTANSKSNNNKKS
jgi:t-SNARE complex subunit (syntaxin)